MLVLLAFACPWLVSGASLWDGMTPGTIAFKEFGTCASGGKAYYGVIQPEVMMEEKSLFLETMGGAICFNHASCSSRDLGMWTDIDLFLRRFLNLDPSIAAVFKSGNPIPISFIPNGIYVPKDATHPFYGKRGLFLPMCTADIFIGHHNATYEPAPIADTANMTCNEAMTGDGKDYEGCQTLTVSGIPCQRWNEPYVKGVNHDVGGNSAVGAHSYCRNPDGEDTIWCYTSDPLLRWDICAPLSEAPKPMKMKHHGGKNLHDLLQLAKAELPDLTKIQMYGASGGGVAATAWAPIVADMWLDAKVIALADSSLHIFPGTELFDIFWKEAQYGSGPAAVSSAKYLMSEGSVPAFDWREADAIAKHLKSHEGRVKIAHMSCLDDPAVYRDRQMMAVFAGMSDFVKTLVNPDTQHDRTWAFLNRLHACSADDSAYSFIMDCRVHHATKDSHERWKTWKVRGSNISMQQFAMNFFNGATLDPKDTEKAYFWFEEHAATEADKCCPSAVRRRRGVVTQPSEDMGGVGCPATPAPPTAASPTPAPRPPAEEASGTFRSCLWQVVAATFGAAYAALAY